MTFCDFYFIQSIEMLWQQNDRKKVQSSEFVSKHLIFFYLNIQLFFLTI